MTGLPELLAEYGIPGAAVGVLRDGEVTVETAGVTDVSTGEPATVDTIFQVGSMTKTFTALAVMQLVDEGRAGLDVPVHAQLPGFRVADARATAEVTPRHLLLHTSGIEEDFGDPGEDDDVYERMVAAIAGAPQVHPVGHTHGYSAALGYAILARLLEVVDGKPWHAVLRDRLFRPLGLTGTAARPADVDPRRAATGHLIRSLAEGPFRTPVDHLPRAFGAGGGITSTAGDVLRLAHVFLAGGRGPDGARIVSAAGIAEMMRSRTPVPDPYLFGPAWALGLIVCDWNGRTAYASDGSTIGQCARLRILPDSNTAVAVLTNGGPRESFGRRVFNEILSGLGEPPIPGLPRPDPALDLDPSAYVGVYGRPGTRFEVRAEGRRLTLTTTTDPMRAAVLGKPEVITYDLQPVSPTHFLMPPAGPLEDTGTLALYEFTDGRARYLHTNCRVHPRLSP